MMRSAIRVAGFPVPRLLGALLWGFGYVAKAISMLISTGELRGSSRTPITERGCGPPAPNNTASSSDPVSAIAESLALPRSPTWKK